MRRILPEIDPHHHKSRILLRLFGPLVVILGVVLTVIGLISFFSSFGTFQPPRYFWATIVGLPLIGIGLAISRFGYLGEIFRYVSREVTPVARDTFNTMAEGTRPGVETMAHAMGRGLTTAMNGDNLAGSGAIPCGRCHASNPADASVLQPMWSRTRDRELPGMWCEASPRPRGSATSAASRSSDGAVPAMIENRLFIQNSLDMSPAVGHYGRDRDDSTNPILVRAGDSSDDQSAEVAVLRDAVVTP